MRIIIIFFLTLFISFALATSQEEPEPELKPKTNNNDSLEHARPKRTFSRMPFVCVAYNISNPVICGLSTTFLSPILTVVSPFAATTMISLDHMDKLVNAAKPDANAYIASEGKDYHTAKLELAFRYIKKHYPDATHMQMAQAILAY